MATWLSLAKNHWILKCHLQLLMLGPRGFLYHHNICRPRLQGAGSDAQVMGALDRQEQYQLAHTLSCHGITTQGENFTLRRVGAYVQTKAVIRIQKRKHMYVHVESNQKALVLWDSPCKKAARTVARSATEPLHVPQLCVHIQLLDDMSTQLMLRLHPECNSSRI